MKKLILLTACLLIASCQLPLGEDAKYGSLSFGYILPEQLPDLGSRTLNDK